MPKEVGFGSGKSHLRGLELRRPAAAAVSFARPQTTKENMIADQDESAAD